MNPYPTSGNFLLPLINKDDVTRIKPGLINLYPPNY